MVFLAGKPIKIRSYTVYIYVLANPTYVLLHFCRICTGRGKDLEEAPVERSTLRNPYV